MRAIYVWSPPKYMDVPLSSRGGKLRAKRASQSACVRAQQSEASVDAQSGMSCKILEYSIMSHATDRTLGWKISKHRNLRRMRRPKIVSEPNGAKSRDLAMARWRDLADIRSASTHPSLFWSRHRIVPANFIIVPASSGRFALIRSQYSERAHTRERDETVFQKWLHM